MTTDLQAFALIVTAEPYYAVRQPSNVVVLENVVRSDTKGTTEAVNAKYELTERDGYIPTGYKFDPVVLDARLPLEFLEARNALRIAQSEGAEPYAGESYQHAVQLMNTASANICWTCGETSGSGQPSRRQGSELPTMKTRTMKSVIASRRRQLMGSWETQGARTNEVCPRCGAQITPLRLSIREMAVTIVCGGLLLSAFASACWMAEQWIEREGHRMLDHMSWHEPVETWDQ